MKPNPICITKQKFKFENEGEKEIEKKGIDEIPYTNLCCIILLCLMLLSLPVPLFFILSLYLLCVCNCSLVFFFVSTLLFAEGSLFIKKFEKLFPPFFVPQLTSLMGNFYGPLFFLHAHAITHSSTFWFVSFLEFSFHRY